MSQIQTNTVVSAYPAHLTSCGSIKNGDLGCLLLKEEAPVAYN